MRFGKFIIADQSTNGTYIRFSDGNVVHITREEISLQGMAPSAWGNPLPSILPKLLSSRSCLLMSSTAGGSNADSFRRKSNRGQNELQELMDVSFA